MDKRIGYLLIVIAIIIVAVALVNRANTGQIIAELANNTGSCYIGSICTHEQNNATFTMLTVLAGVIAVIGIMIIVLNKHKPKVVFKTKFVEKPIETKAETKPEPIPSLEGEQKKVYELIVAAGGSALQGELVEKSGMNKVTLSRILDKLEMRSLIERRRHGMSNLVILRKK